MIKIYESITGSVLRYSKVDEVKALNSKKFIDYIKSNYKDDYATASVDVALALNTFCEGSAIARPIDYKDNDSIYIDLNNVIYDVLNAKEIRNIDRSLILNPTVTSPSLDYYDLVNLLNELLIEINNDTIK